MIKQSFYRSRRLGERKKHNLFTEVEDFEKEISESFYRRRGLGERKKKEMFYSSRRLGERKNTIVLQKSRTWKRIKQPV